MLSKRALWRGETTVSELELAKCRVRLALASLNFLKAHGRLGFSVAGHVLDPLRVKGLAARIAAT